MDVTIKNSAKQKHELKIIHTDTAPEDLPTVSGKDIVDEKKAGKTAGEFGAVNGGASDNASFDLTPGHYILRATSPATTAKGWCPRLRWSSKHQVKSRRCGQANSPHGGHYCYRAVLAGPQHQLRCPDAVWLKQ